MTHVREMQVNISVVHGLNDMSPTPGDRNTTALVFRIEALEKEVREKVPLAEYTIQIQNIRETNVRLDDALNRLILQVTMIQDKLIEQEIKAEQRSAAHQKAISDLQAEHRQSLAQFQLRIFYWFISIVGVVVSGYLVWVFTHPH